MNCIICDSPDAPHRAPSLLSTQEKAAVAAYGRSFQDENGNPVYHTGHLKPELMELPARVCEAHKVLKAVAPWTPSEKFPENLVRFADPHDGRTWDLDGSPRWLAIVEPCCDGERRHWVWTLGDKDKTGKRPSGSEKTREAAQEEADQALRHQGWSAG